MKSEQSLFLAAAFAVLAAGSSAAKAPADAETALRAALAAVSPAKPLPSCAHARELETSFELAIYFRGGVEPKTLSFEYAGCAEEGRNDSLAAYTVRAYKGADGYGLAIVTDRGASSSEALVSRGKDRVAQFAGLSNAALASGDPVPGGVITVKDASSERRGLASIRDAGKPLFPPLTKCELDSGSLSGAVAANHACAGWPR